MGFPFGILSFFTSSRSATKKKTFGYHRIEILLTLVFIGVVWLIIGVLVFCAVARFIDDDHHVNGVVMIFTSWAPLAVKTIILILHSLNRRTSALGGNSRVVGTEQRSTIHPIWEKNLRPSLPRYIPRFISSILVVVSAIVICVVPEHGIIDAISCIALLPFVVLLTWEPIKEVVDIMMEGTPPHLHYGEVKDALLKLPDVVQVHSLRMWSFTAGRSALVAHLTTNDLSKREAILTSSHQLLRNRFSISENTVQIEALASDMQDCDMCKDPRG